MLHSRWNNNVKNLHETYLQLIYNHKSSSNDASLINFGPVSIHHKNIQNLAIEMFKFQIDLSSENVSDIFLQQTHTQFNLWNRGDFRTPVIKYVYHGSVHVLFLSPEI